MSVMRPELIMKSIIPVVMAGIIAIYGLVVAVLIAGNLEKVPKYDLYTYVSLFFSDNASVTYNKSAAVTLRFLFKYNKTL